MEIQRYWVKGVSLLIRHALVLNDSRWGIAAAFDHQTLR
jgi:hypothetical protein